MAGREMLDVVDEEDQVIGQASRRQVHEEGLLHRVVHVLLVDEAGRIVLQRRSRAKRTYPGTWTSSASGHVTAGSSPVDAARRETKEELGVYPHELQHVGTTRFQDPTVGEDEIAHVFVGPLPGTPEPDPEEVSEVRHVQPSMLEARVSSDPRSFAPNFPPVLELAMEAVADQGPREPTGTP